MRRFAPLLLILALASPAAAARSTSLTVSGTGSVATDWQVTTPTTLDFTRVTLSTKASVVAFAVEDLGHHEVLALAADAPRLEYDVSSPVYGPIKNSSIGPEHTVDSVTLRPGRYRVRLVTSDRKPSTAVVPVTKGRGATLTARTPTAGLAVLADPRVKGSEASSWQSDFRFKGKGMGLLATHEHTYIYGTSAIDECVQEVTESGSTPCRLDPAIASTAAFGGGAVGDGWCRSTLYFNPAWMPSGRYHAEVTSATVGVDKEVWVLLVVVEPSP